MDLNDEAGMCWKIVGALKTSSVSERRQMSVLGGAVMVKDSCVGSSLGTEAPFMHDQFDILSIVVCFEVLGYVGWCLCSLCVLKACLECFNLFFSYFLETKVLSIVVVVDE